MWYKLFMKSFTIFIIFAIVFACTLYVVMIFFNKDKTVKAKLNQESSTIISPLGVVGGVVGVK